MSDQYELDELDKNILRELNKDGRKPFREIAEEVDSTSVTVTNRIEKLEENDVIEGYSVEINHEKLGFSQVAAIELDVEGGHLDEVKQMVLDWPQITSAYEITGDFDILIVGKFRQNELKSFIVEELLESDKIDNTLTHMALDLYMEREDKSLLGLLSGSDKNQNS